jgi:GntR family transcriptional repressor for pyruvate dehydrogenase complex
MQLSTAPLSQGTVHRLIELIQAEGLGVGDRLPSIRQLAVRLEVRPNVVRDALMQAQTMGLLKIHPRSGAFVRSLNYEPLVDALAKTLETSLLQTDANLFHLLEARQLIEVELVGQAAERRRVQDLLPVRDALAAMGKITGAQQRPEYVEEDIRFHLAIAEVAGNSVLTVTLQALLGLLRPFLCRLPFDPPCRLRTQSSHADIYRALVEGSREKARAHMEAHVRFAYETLLGEVESLPDVRTGTRG